MKKKTKLVHVLWHDTMTVNGWTSIDSILEWKFIPMESYGLIVRQDEEVVVLAGLVGNDGDLNALQFIPAGCILKIEEV